MSNSRETFVVASDHAGYALKEALKRDLSARGLDILDLGAADPETSVDYPDFGYAAAQAIAQGRAQRGLVVCGSGIGISIAANRLPQVRAALCHDEQGARLAREHNDANMLALGARVIDEARARKTLAAFLDTPFEGGRHTRRVEKLSMPKE